MYYFVVAAFLLFLFVFFFNDTAAPEIYTEVKKGIKPEMYALSTIIFVTVLVLLLLVNYMPMAKKKK